MRTSSGGRRWAKTPGRRLPRRKRTQNALRTRAKNDSSKSSRESRPAARRPGDGEATRIPATRTRAAQRPLRIGGCPRPQRGGGHAAIRRGQGGRTARGEGANRTGFVRAPRYPRRESEGYVGPGTIAHGERGRTPSRRTRARGPRTRTRIERAPGRSSLDRDVCAGDGAHPARAGAGRSRDPARRDGPSVRVGGEGEAPGMGVAPDEFAVPTGAIHHDIGISHHRTGEENRRTRGPRPKPTGGVRPARDGPIETRRRSEGPDGQVGGSGGCLATIGGPARGAQDKGRRAPPGPPVIRIGALHVVRPPDRGAEATRGDAGCSRPAGPAGRATRRGVPAAGPGPRRSGRGLATPTGPPPPP